MAERRLTALLLSPVDVDHADGPAFLKDNIGVRTKVAETVEIAIEFLRDLAQRSQSPAVILIAPDWPQQVAVARAVHAAAPAAYLMLLTSRERLSMLRNELTRTPKVGSLWSVVEADDAMLPKILDDAIRSVSQRKLFRTTIDRMNIQLANRPPVDSSDFRRLVLSDRFLAEILTHTGDAIISLDATGTVHGWNRGAEKMFGTSAADALGKPLRDSVAQCTPVSDIVAMLQADEELARKRIDCDTDAGQLQLELTVNPLRHDDGSPLGSALIIRDVTDRIRAEGALRASEERHRLLIENVKDFAIFMMDRDRKVTTWNAGAEELLGYEADEAIGQSADVFFTPEDRAAGMPAREMLTARDTGRASDIRWHLRKNGQRFFVDGVMTAVRDEAGSLLGYAKLMRDVTERWRAEQAREQLLETERKARADAERAGRMKDEFLATLSHELRTPLNAILGWSQIIKSSDYDPDDITQGLEVIERNARAQSQIIEDLLDMSRIISGKVRIDVQRVDLSAIVAAAVDTVRPTAEAKGVRLLSIIDPLHGAVVSGDGNRLQQIMWNLLTNATKFTPKGGRIQVLLERVNSHIEISVIDTGEGIAVEFLPFVFDRFRQADASTTRRHGGLGLGLSIVKQLAELHGGSVRVKSLGLGKGATFIVALPLTVVHAEPESKEERRHPRSSPQPAGILEPCIGVGGVRVLVVDDEPDAREVVKRLLADCNAIVTTAGTASEALGLIEGGEFDVLVSDIGMPGADGYSLIERVRALSRENGGDIPAIALTAYARVEDRVKAIAAGFHMHVVKPVEPIELITMVVSAAGRTGRTRA